MDEKLEIYKLQIKKKIDPCRTYSIKYAILNTELGHLTYLLGLFKDHQVKDRILMLKKLNWLISCLQFVNMKIGG